MNINIRYNLDRVYRKDTPPHVIKEQLYQGKVRRKYMRTKPSTVYLWASVAGDQMKFCTGFRIAPVDWDFKRRRPRNNAPHAAKLSALLDRLKSRCEEAVLDAQLRNPRLTFEDVRGVLHGVLHDNQPAPRKNEFFPALDEFIEERSEELKWGTIKKYRNFRALLAEFESNRRGKIYFDGIDRDLERDLKDFLAKEKGHVNDSVGKTLKVLKVFMGWAVEKGYTENEEFRKFQVKSSKKDIITLTEEELEAIGNLDLTSEPELEGVRDLFLFACYTGQRYGDLQALTLEQITTDEQGNRTWRLFQEKGDKEGVVEIPLSGRANEILDKYREQVKREDASLLPRVANQVANRRVKQVCELAGITQKVQKVRYSGKQRKEETKRKCDLITMHTGRRSYITLSIVRGMSAEAIMRITGHQSYQTVRQSYLNLDQAYAKEQHLQVWDKS